ncbi:MAG: hypothetical protein AB1715_11470, partial [Acidobacteriota bacterium]
MIQIHAGCMLKGPFWPERVRVISVKTIGENQTKIEAVGLESSKFYNPILTTSDLEKIDIAT